MGLIDVVNDIKEKELDHREIRSRVDEANDSVSGGFTFEADCKTDELSSVGWRFSGDYSPDRKVLAYDILDLSMMVRKLDLPFGHTKIEFAYDLDELFNMKWFVAPFNRVLLKHVATTFDPGKTRFESEGEESYIQVETTGRGLSIQATGLYRSHLYDLIRKTGMTAIELELTEQDKERFLNNLRVRVDPDELRKLEYIFSHCKYDVPVTRRTEQGVRVGFVPRYRIGVNSRSIDLIRKYLLGGILLFNTAEENSQAVRTTRTFGKLSRLFGLPMFHMRKLDSMIEEMDLGTNFGNSILTTKAAHEIIEKEFDQIRSLFLRDDVDYGFRVASIHRKLVEVGHEDVYEGCPEMSVESVIKRLKQRGYKPRQYGGREDLVKQIHLLEFAYQMYRKDPTLLLESTRADYTNLKQRAVVGFARREASFSFGSPYPILGLPRGVHIYDRDGNECIVERYAKGKLNVQSTIVLESPGLILPQEHALGMLGMKLE